MVTPYPPPLQTIFFLKFFSFLFQFTWTSAGVKYDSLSIRPGVLETKIESNIFETQSCSKITIENTVHHTGLYISSHTDSRSKASLLPITHKPSTLANYARAVVCKILANDEPTNVELECSWQLQSETICL